MTSKLPIFVDHSRRLRNATAMALGCLIGLCLVYAPLLDAQSAAGTPKTSRKVMVRVQPQYPAVLREGRFEGQVRLAATVLPNGSVTKVENRGGNPMLSQFAEEAVMRWKYAPASAQTVEEVVFNFSPGGK